MKHRWILFLHFVASALAQLEELNYFAITGWYGNGCSSVAEDRCVGLPFYPLIEPIYLDLVMCYVNPSSTSAVTFYKQTSSGIIVEFNVIFTFDLYARMPVTCSSSGECECGSDFAQIQQELGDDCNNLLSIIYKCTSRPIQQVQPSTCYSPSNVVVPRNTTNELECSMVAKLESFANVYNTTSPTISPTLVPSTILAPGPGGEQLTLEPSLAPSSSPSSGTVQAGTAGGGSDGVQLAIPTSVPSDAGILTPSDLNGNGDGGFNVGPGVIAGCVIAGIVVVWLLLWANRKRLQAVCTRGFGVTHRSENKYCNDEHDDEAALSETFNAAQKSSKPVYDMEQITPVTPDETSTVASTPMSPQTDEFLTRDLTSRSSSRSTQLMSDSSRSMTESTRSLQLYMESQAMQLMDVPRPPYRSSLKRLLSERSNRSTTRSIFSNSDSSSGKRRAYSAMTGASGGDGRDFEHSPTSR